MAGLFKQFKSRSEKSGRLFGFQSNHLFKLMLPNRNLDIVYIDDASNINLIFGPVIGF